MATDRRVGIVVDSAASLPPDAHRLEGLHLVPMRLTFGDRTYDDGEELSPAEFYRMLRDSSDLPTTSAPSPAAFLKAFTHASREVEAVLCLTVASRFSASSDSAVSAAREAGTATPGLEVIVLDSGTAAGGEGLVALEAWRAAGDGQDLEQVKAAAEAVIARVRLLAFVDTLHYLWKGGRVPGIAHAGASLLRLKPMFELAEGEVTSVARPRTTRNAVKKLKELMGDRVAADRPVHAAVLHADAAAPAEELHSWIESEFECEELYVSEFSPVMGAHIGPGLVGVAFWTEDLPKSVGA